MGDVIVVNRNTNRLEITPALHGPHVIAGSFNKRAWQQNATANQASDHEHADSRQTAKRPVERDGNATHSGDDRQECRVRAMLAGDDHPGRGGNDDYRYDT